MFNGQNYMFSVSENWKSRQKQSRNPFLGSFNSWLGNCLWFQSKIFGRREGMVDKGGRATL